MAALLVVHVIVAVVVPKLPEEILEMSGAEFCTVTLSLEVAYNPEVSLATA